MNEPMTDLMIKGVPVAEYQRLDLVECPMCEARPTRRARVLAWWQGARPAVATLRYCPGGKPPTEGVCGLHAMVTGQSEVSHDCAGIMEAHFHAVCRCCGFGWLTKTKAPR